MSQFDALPDGWKKSKIGDLCTLINGKAFKPDDWTEVGLKIVRIQNLNKEEALFNHFSGEVDSKFIIEDGELLFAWSGTPGTSFGAHIWNRGKAVLNQHIFRVVFDESHLDKIFFRHAINQKLQELIDKAHGGVGLRHVTKGKFEQTAIPLPPLNEQRRIVEKIEALTARSCKARAALDEIPALLDQFRQSVLAAAFRGDLTADWRSQNPDVEPAETRWRIVKPTCQNELLPELPENWGYRELESFSERVSVGHVGSTSEFYCNADEGVPFIRSQNVRPARLDLQEVKYITREFHKKLKKSQLKTGDLLIVRVGANRGDTCFLPPGIGEINCANIVFARPFPGISQYLELFFQSELCQKELLNLTTGSAQGVINTKSVAKVLVPIPPIEEQSEILKNIWESFAFIKTIEDLLSEIDEEAKLMDQSILAKAFRGELVPQDPNDEPAAVMLDRIRAERERLGSGKKRGKAKG